MQTRCSVSRKSQNNVPSISPSLVSDYFLSRRSDESWLSLVWSKCPLNTIGNSSDVLHDGSSLDVIAQTYPVLTGTASSRLLNIAPCRSTCLEVFFVMLQWWMTSQRTLLQIRSSSNFCVAGLQDDMILFDSGSKLHHEFCVRHLACVNTGLSLLFSRVEFLQVHPSPATQQRMFFLCSRHSSRNGWVLPSWVRRAWSRLGPS